MSEYCTQKKDVFIMKNKYGIGFLLFLILIVFGITCAYQLSLNTGKNVKFSRAEKQQKSKTQDLSVAADGQVL